jgi:hypothetical protein
MRLSSLLLLASVALSGCAQRPSGAVPKRAFPAKAEVLFERSGGHELVGGLHEELVFVIGRPAATDPEAEPWLNELGFLLWCDLDGDGKRSKGEVVTSGSASGEPQRERGLEYSLPSDVPSGPLLLELRYRDSAGSHVLGPKRVR